MKTQICVLVLSELSSILKSAYFKLDKEIKALQLGKVQGDLRKIAIDKLLNNNQKDIETLNDFEEIVEILDKGGNGNSLPNRLRSKNPCLGKRFIADKNRMLHHGHISIDGEFDSIVWCESPYLKGMLILAIDKHPKGSYNQLINKAVNNSKDKIIAVSTGSTNLKNKSKKLYNERNSINVLVKSGNKTKIKALKLIAFNESKTILFYSGNNSKYLFVKIDKGYLCCEVTKDKEDKQYLELDKYGKFLPDKEIDVLSILYNHILKDDLFIEISPKNQRKVDIKEFDKICPKNEILFKPAKDSKLQFESLKKIIKIKIF